MKDALEYTVEELNELSIEELEALYKNAEMKETEFNVRQLIEKTLMNSLYGALGNRHFPLFNEEMAAAITGNGRYFIQKLAKYIEKKLQSMIPYEKGYVIYSDTDSVYFQIEPFMNVYQKQNPNLSINEYVNLADNFEKKIIQPIIQEVVDDFSKELNAYNKSVIKAEREIISDVSIFSAKKKYIARVRDSEGTRYPENEPYMKVMGLEIAKSSTPTWAKKKLKESINIILDSEIDELMEWVEKCKSEFKSANLNDIAQVGSASSLDYSISSKGIPIGSRAAICHNNYLKDNKLDEKYTLVQAGDKSKRLFLIEPNNLKSNIVAFNSDSFVNEISDIVDYDTNFEKGFLNALQLMINPLGWDLSKKTESLDDW